MTPKPEWIDTTVLSDPEIEDHVGKVVAYLKSLVDPNLKAIADDCGAPYPRVYHHYHGRLSRYDCEGPNRHLSPAQEESLCKFFKILDDLGLSLRLSLIAGSANELLAQEHLGEETSPKVSYMWLIRFRERHPEFFKKRQKTIDINWQKAHDVEDIDEWYCCFLQACRMYGIDEADIWNVNETGFMIGIGKDQWVLTLDPDRPCHLGSSTNRELVTVIEAVSGDGIVIPPMVILPGKVHQEHWYTKTGLEDNYLIVVSESGYSNDHVALCWLAHFQKFTKSSCPGAYRMLILDGHASHKTILFHEYASRHQIKLFFLIPYTTHLLQPLDVVIFQPYKHYHAEAIDEVTRLGCSNFNETEFLTSLSSIREKTFQKSTILLSF
jgi:hypothetical protein